MFIYIKEAHAADTWPLGIDPPIYQTHTSEDRCATVREFLAREPLEEARVLVDSAPENSFDETFAAWPLRFYVIDFHLGEHCVSFIAEPHGDKMPLEDLEVYLTLRGL